MKNKLQELFDNNPSTFTQKLKSKANKSLYDWFLTETQHISEQSIKGRAIIFLQGIDTSCSYGNKKQFSQGKIRFCGSAGACQCHTDHLNSVASKGGFWNTEKEKEEFLKNRKNNWDEKYGGNPLHLPENKEKQKLSMQTTEVRNKLSKSNSSEEVQQKTKTTNLEKYGVEHPMQQPKVQEKLSNTMIRNHGVEYYTQSADFQEKSKNTCNERYGVDNVMQTDEVKEKVRKTIFDTYGVDYAMQSVEVKEKVKQEWIVKYGVEHPSKCHIPKDTIEKLNNEDWLKEQILIRPPKTIADELNVSSSYFRKFLRLNNIPINNKFVSLFEQDVVNFITGLGIRIEQHNRSLVSPYEIDIYLPDHNIAIECNGSYWHSELQGKDKKYHLHKTDVCQDKGIHLIHIWEHTWYDKTQLLMSRIKSKLGINQRIYARKTQIREVTSSDAARFLVNNHIQGACPASVRYGAYYDNKLVGLMTFGKSRYDKKIQWELIRYCSKQGINIVGGASKLFKHFTKSCEVSGIISYSDRMWNTGQLYEALGFTFSHTTPASYYYTKNYETFENRVSYQKHKLKDKLSVFDSNLTEWENMKANGFDRIFDCGNNIYKMFLE